MNNVKNVKNYIYNLFKIENRMLFFIQFSYRYVFKYHFQLPTVADHSKYDIEYPNIN